MNCSARSACDDAWTLSKHRQDCYALDALHPVPDSQPALKQDRAAQHLGALSGMSNSVPKRQFICRHEIDTASQTHVTEVLIAQCQCTHPPQLPPQQLVLRSALVNGACAAGVGVLPDCEAAAACEGSAGPGLCCSQATRHHCGAWGQPGPGGRPVCGGHGAQQAARARPAHQGTRHGAACHEGVPLPAFPAACGKSWGCSIGWSGPPVLSLLSLLLLHKASLQKLSEIAMACHFQDRYLPPDHGQRQQHSIHFRCLCRCSTCRTPCSLPGAFPLCATPPPPAPSPLQGVALQLCNCLPR